MKAARARIAAGACPCGGKSYAECCQRWHLTLAAPTAEALMRSRYSAFVLGLESYLLDSWHPDTRPETLELDPAVKWLGLEVKRADAISPTEATVEFVARYRVGGRAVRLHEISRFLRLDGRWYYLDGVQET